MHLNSHHKDNRDTPSNITLRFVAIYVIELGMWIAGAMGGGGVVVF
jgi:hypothetical protein